MASPNQLAAPWLARIDELASEIVPMTIPVENDTLGMIKNMLLAPADDTEAVDRTVQEIRAYYATKFFPPDDDFYRNLPDHALRNILGPVVDHVFDLVGAVSRAEMGHKRLADLLVGLKKTAAAEFDHENPQMGWTSIDIDIHAGETWQRYCPEPASAMAECNDALNVHALLARLIAADMLTEDGPWRMASCIAEGLQDPLSKGFSIADTPLTRTCRAAIATQYILIAGDVLVKELKNKPGLDNEKALKKGEWSFWALRLGQLASDGGEEEVEEWDLKGSAEEARKKVEGWLREDV